MVRWTVFVVLLQVACGTSPSSSPDATPHPPDAGTDAAPGDLTADPPDPTSIPCNSILGFPTPPVPPTLPGEITVPVDVDGDGNKDLVVRRFDSFAVARGNGDGTFQSPAFFPGVLNSFDFKVTDVNNDSKPDLVYGTENGFQHDVRVALNDGSGVFGTPRVVDMGSLAADQLAVVDVNGDARKDVVTRTFSSAMISVLINNGNGFNAPQSFSTASSQGVFPQRMEVSDITGDSKPDVITTSNGRVSVLVNQGAGTFATVVDYPVPTPIAGIAVFDANEDGKRDVIVGGSQPNGGQIYVLLNQGAGVLGTAVAYSAGTSTIPALIAAEDLDNDGHIDIVLTDLNSNARVLLGTGAGQFGSSVEIVKSAPLMIALADLNNDGRIDLILGGGSTTAYMNRGLPTLFESRASYIFETDANETSYGGTVIDLDDDARPDLLRWRSYALTSTMTARYAMATGGFGPATSLQMPFIPFSAERADMNNDDRQDLVFASSSMNEHGATTMLNQGDGSLIASITAPTNGTSPTRMRLADVDGDGKRDLVARLGLGFPDDEVRYFAGVGDGSFAASQQLWLGSNAISVLVSDVNEDGHLDVLIANRAAAYQLDILLGQGQGSFMRETFVPPVDAPVDFARDFNGDGHIDVGGFASGGNVSIILGHGNGTFDPPLRSPVGVFGPALFAFADFDGDSHLDIAAISGTNVIVMLGAGDGTFRGYSYDVGEGVSSLNVADVDLDGRVDIFVDNISGAASVLYGRCL